MTDYGKLTVVKLKEVLKDRGLPTTGLKAALVARLVENDALQHEEGEDEEEEEKEEEEEEEGASADTADNDEETVAEAAPETNEQEVVTSKQQQEEEGEGDEDGEEEASPATLPATSHSPQPPDEPPKPAAENVDDTAQEIAEQQSQALPSSNDGEAQASSIAIQPIVVLPADTPALAPGAQQATEGVLPQPGELQKMVESAGATTDPTIPLSPGPIDREELAEDSSKRKRRSKSPAPTERDTAVKKAKAMDGRPRVIMEEDRAAEDPGDEGTETPVEALPIKSARVEALKEDLEEKTEHPASAPVPAPAPAPEPSVATTLGTPEEPSKMDVDEDVPATALGGLHPEPQQDASKVADATQQQASQIQRSPTNARYKNLFAPPPPKDNSSVREAAPLEDRDVAPAMHPATTALYIRNFMRPLHPGNLRDHLEKLARSPGDALDQEMIVEFFLDSIKSHCLVQFGSISAASRVRLALHNRVWPDERTRKALWVDYAPEEKIKKWIEVEHEAGRGRSTGQKRWEVVYENENGGVVAYLQEADPNSLGSGGGAGGGGGGGGGSSAAAATSSGLGSRSYNSAEAARNGSLGDSAKPPRESTRGQRPPAPPAPPVPPPAAAPSSSLSSSAAALAPRGDQGKGFKALDDLFRSTVTAKPKLYFLPASADLANRRLEKLAEATRGSSLGHGGGGGGGGGGSVGRVGGDETRRYSFEDMVIVDKGPEFGAGRRGRGGRSGRGGYKGFVERGPPPPRRASPLRTDNWRER